MKMGERVAQLETAHEALKIEVDKKLSKHEFNGLSHIVQDLKDLFLKQFEKHENALADNTKSICALQTTFENMKGFLPALIKTIKFFGSIIIVLVCFIGSKLMGWW